MSKFKKLKYETIQNSTNSDLYKKFYWKKMKTIKTLQQNSSINSLSIKQTSSGENFMIYSCKNTSYLYDFQSQLTKNFSKTSKEVLTTNLRSDGALLSSAGEDCVVHLFNPAEKSLLRLLCGHNDKINHAEFSIDSITKITSFSEDKSIRFWDIPQQAAVIELLDAHSAGVNFGLQKWSDGNVWASAGSDNKVKFWDFRHVENAQNRSKSVLEIDVFSKALKILLPKTINSLCLALTDSEIAAIDIRKPDVFLKQIKRHHKPLTDATINNEYLISCALDCYFKVFDLKTFDFCYQRRFEEPLTAISFNLENEHLSIGTKSGKITILANKNQNKLQKNQKNSKNDTIIEKLSLDLKLSQEGETSKDLFKRPLDKDSIVVIPRVKHRKLSPYEKDLKSFRYKKAFDRILYKKTVQTGLFESLLIELMEQNALQVALVGRNKLDIKLILSRFQNHLTNPKFSFVFIHAFWTLISIYQNTFECDCELKEILNQILEKIKAENEFQKRLMALVKSIKVLMDK